MIGETTLESARVFIGKWLLPVCMAPFLMAAAGCRSQPGEPLPQVAVIFDTAKEDVTGVQGALLADLAQKDVTGAQIGGAVNFADGRLTGAQIVVILNNADGGVRGAQIAGLLSVTAGEVDGVQVGLIAGTVAGPVRGVQVGGANRARRLSGWQGGVVNEISPGEEGPAGGGAQVGLVNVMRAAWQEETGVAEPRREFTGAQVGVLNVSRVRLAGAQSGLANYLDAGACQVGILNWAGRCDAQAGLVNVSRSARSGEWQVGLLNFMKDGWLPAFPLFNYCP